VDLLAAFSAPDLGKAIHGYVVVLPAIAEPAMVLYPLIVGVKTAKPEAERTLAAA
jgi:hypothetical protein